MKAQPTDSPKGRADTNEMDEDWADIEDIRPMSQRLAFFRPRSKSSAKTGEGGLKFDIYAIDG